MTDDRRVPEPTLPLGTTSYDSPGLVPDGVPTAHILRTVISGFFATASTVLGATALVVAVTALFGLTPDRPMRMVSVTLSAPEVRAALVEELVTELDETGTRPLSADTRAQMADAFDKVLASEEFHRELEDLQVVDGQIDGTRIVAALSAELEAQSVGRPDDVRQALELAARDLPHVAEREGMIADAEETVEIIGKARIYVLVLAAVLLIPALVAGGIALAVARRRALTAVLIPTGALLLTAVVLSPGRWLLEHLPGPLDLPGGLMAALGSLVGTGLVWTLILLALVPPAIWWAARNIRGQRESSTITS